MSHKYAGGCDHVHSHSDNDPIDVHTCHCSVCKGVTGQDSTHVAFFNYGDMRAAIPEVVSVAALSCPHAVSNSARAAPAIIFFIVDDLFSEFAEEVSLNSTL